MFFAGRKFFIYAGVILPLFACALPNFAALAPTVEPTINVNLDIPTRPVIDDIEATPAETIEWPSAPVAIDQLPAAQILPAVQETEPVQISLGLPYQLTRSAVLLNSPPSGQSVVYWGTNGAKIDLKLSDGSPIGDLVIVETDVNNYYLVPLPAENVTYSMSVELAGEGPAQVQGDFFFGFPPERPFETSEVPAEDVGRVELDGVANRPVLIELRPSAGLDAVLEIYDSDGVLLSVDEAGAGESEGVIYTPQQTGRLTLVISGFQGSSGPFEINVTQFP